MAQIAGRRLPLLMVAVLLITSLPSFAPGALTRSDRLTGAMAQSLHVSRERALGFEKRRVQSAARTLLRVEPKQPAEPGGLRAAWMDLPTPEGDKGWLGYLRNHPI